MSEKAPKKKAEAKKAAPKKTVKPKKTKVKAENEEAKVIVQRVSLGPSPRPTVNSRHGFSMHEREARGYSFGELESAGIGRGDVRRLSIPVDIRRRTALEHNVERLKGWFKEPERKAAPEPSTEKTGGKAAHRRGKKAAEEKRE